MKTIKIPDNMRKQDVLYGYNRCKKHVLGLIDKFGDNLLMKELKARIERK